MRLLIGFLVCLMGSTATFAQLPNSVAGIQLGMTSAQVRAKLNPKFVEQMQKQTIYPGEPYPSAFEKPLTDERAWLEDSRDGWSFQYVDDRLVYIQHVSIWIPKDAPNYGQTKDDLFSKFGTPTFGGESNGASYMWEWNTNGQLLTKRGPCDLNTQSIGISNIGDLAYPKGASPTCGVEAEATIRTDGARVNPTMNTLSIKLLNAKAFYDALIQQQKRIKAEQQKAIDQSKTRRAPM